MHKTPLDMSPYCLIFCKACHLPVELKHIAYWAIKKLNFDMKASGETQILQLNELDEFQIEAYENAKLCKEKTKKWYDQNILRCAFEPGQHVLLFNSRLKLFPEKLKLRWSVPFIVNQVFPREADEIYKHG